MDALGCFDGYGRGDADDVLRYFFVQWVLDE